MALTYLYARLRISLATSAIHALFIESAQGLESLSEVLSTILTDNTLSQVYLDASVIDIVGMREMTPDAAPLAELLTEFHLLTRMIREIHTEHAFKNLGRLNAIHLELPNTLILEYRTTF